MLNDKQKKNLLLGMLAVVAMGVYPPWKEFGPVEKPSTFAPIYQPPSVSSGSTRLDIDFSRLGLEIFLAFAVTGGLVLAAGGRPDPQFIAKGGTSGFTPTQPAGAFAGAFNQGSQAAQANLANSASSQSGNGQSGNGQSGGGQAQNAKTGIRVELPRDYYLGEVFVESDEDSEYWEDYCQAKGAIDLPKNKKVQLELAKDIKVDLSFLSAFPSGALYMIDASDTQVGDSDMSKLGSLDSVRELDLSGTTIGSTGVKGLKGLGRLEKLWLDGTAIDDDCVPTLSSFSHLKKLSITETTLSELSIENLKKDLPNCELIT